MPQPLQVLAQSPARTARTATSSMAGLKAEMLAGIVLAVTNKLAFLADERVARVTTVRRPLYNAGFVTCRFELDNFATSSWTGSSGRASGRAASGHGNCR